MHHPLDNSRLKADRARHLYEDLAHKAKVFEREHPMGFGHARGDSGEETFTFRNPPDLPDEWTLLVGEIAHNARSALNYIVAAAVRLTGVEPDLGNDFPIYDDERKFAAATPRKLKNVPPPIAKKIADVQPFRSGKGASMQPLTLLQDLNNPDKHSDPSPAWAHIVGPWGTVQMFGTVDWTLAQVKAGPNGQFKEAIIAPGPTATNFSFLMRPPSRRHQGNARVAVEYIFGSTEVFYVTLHELHRIVQYTDGLVEWFWSDFT